MTPHQHLTARIAAEPWWGWTVLEDPAWRAVWDAVPRQAFVPDQWFTWDGYRYVQHDRAIEPEAWTRAVEADEPVITQIDGGIPSCSNSAPSLVAAMLDGLDLAPGMRVFESGTGTGWTTALMYRRVAPDGVVVSVEYDRALAKRAEIDTFDVGAYPVIRAGDGMAGAPDMAPFDRVSATHAVARIPQAWIGQTRPGGLVCAPLLIADQFDVFVRLDVAEDGSASGPVLFPVSFMGDRAAAPPAAQERVDDMGRETTGTLDVPQILADRRFWVLQLAVPGLTVAGPLVEDGDDTVWLSLPDGSWAVGWVPQGASWDGCTVVQYGRRDVWTLAEQAWARWEDAGRPALDDFGLTVTADGVHRLWMREPGNVIAELG